jgi:hypothetical protein
LVLAIQLAFDYTHVKGLPGVLKTDYSTTTTANILVEGQREHTIE